MTFLAEITVGSGSSFNKYVRPRNTRLEIYAGRVAFCPIISHGEYTSRALLRFEKIRDRQTDGQTDARPLFYANR